MYIGGTTLLTESYRPAEKAKTQGANDLIVFSIMGISSFSSGALVSAAGWERMNAGALPVLVVVALAVTVARLAARAARSGRGVDVTARRVGRRRSPGDARPCRHPRRQFPNSEDHGGMTMEWLATPEAWIALADAHRARDRAGRRQHHLHLDPGRPPAAGRSGSGRA